MRGDVLDQEGGRERLHRLPAVEAVAVMGGEEGEIAVAQVRRQLDRSREAAIERHHRTLVEAGLAVHRLEPIEATLEQRFLEITSRLGEEPELE